MPEAQARRRARVLERVHDEAPEAHGLLVTSLTNVRYLTGFTGSNAVLLLADDEAVLGTDARYAVQAAEQCPDLPILLDRATLPAVARRAADAEPLAVESEHLRVCDLRALEDVVTGRLIEVSGVVESVRVVKEPAELAAIARACEISDAALAATVSRVAVGVTEREIARWIEAAMFENGADEISFATIVASGPHSAKPHHEPTERPVATGDLLLIDFGATVAGYHADETRTFVLGEPQQWQREIHEVVERAQTAGRQAATAGMDARAVDAAARNVVVAAGYGEHFDHGLGHGVGLDIHEAPYFSARATGMLPAGSSVTIEPGIYLPGRGGVRIEDTILVTDGPSRSLTTTRRALVALG